MRARRAVLTFFLIFGLAAQATAASISVIVDAPLAAIDNVLRSVPGSSRIDNIPGTNIYLFNVPSPSLLSPLAIQFEINQGVTQPASGQTGVLTVPSDKPSDWYKSQPSMLRMHAADALHYSTGRGIVVADINSGVDVGHPALIGHLTTGYDFVTNKAKGTTALNQSSAGFMDQSSAGFMDQSSAGFMDQSSAGFMDTSNLPPASANPAYSHGTLCAGIIAAVAPDSMIMPLRVFDDQGSADIFTIVKAIHHAVDQGAQVINMSFGTLEPSETLENAISFALRRNVSLVASAGNNNTAEPQYPAAYSGVITTAATDLLDRKASFSNYGGSVFVDAPGVNIFSAYPGGYYGIVSGTSFSAPAVAGTAALIRSLRASAIADSLAGGSVNIDSGNPGYARQLGHGRIDVLRAVKPD